jgi:tetratricopeptide (TPR) repeat protein
MHNSRIRGKKMANTNAQEEKFDEIGAHKYFAGGLFNRCWELIDKGAERTEEEDEEMLLSAQASAYHWLKLKGHVAEERWVQAPAISHDQISMVYAELGNGEMALTHAQKCLEWCEKNGIGDFVIAFAHLRFATAYDLLGDTEKRNEYIRKAHESSKEIAKDGDREYFLSELKKVPGYDEAMGDA